MEDIKKQREPTKKKQNDEVYKEQQRMVTNVRIESRKLPKIMNK